MHISAFFENAFFALRHLLAVLGVFRVLHVLSAVRALVLRRAVRFVVDLVVDLVVRLFHIFSFLKGK